MPKVHDLSAGQTGWTAFPTIPEHFNPAPDEQFYSWGELLLPEGAGVRVPAIIVVHGSGGTGYTDSSWAQFLRSQGFATFKLDYFGPRGVHRDSRIQPTPTDDVVAALRLLATHPRIDPNRIGVIGLSRGANMALRAADAGWKRLSQGQRFAAHVALYPTCSMHRDLDLGNEAPVLVLIGSRDDLATVQECESIVSGARAKGRDASLKVYDGAYHSWDGNWSGVWYHAAASRSFEVRADAGVTARSRQDVAEFLARTLKP